ncbi:MAG: tryptophan-rich sensory protein [Acidithiobacillus sp.]|nr:tryptophan-rich sensory protein [Acidithiobacillus sp.]
MINHFAVVAFASLVLTLAVATIGSLFRPDPWYEHLRKLSPPHSLVLAAIGVFAAINSVAALLLVPYGLWLFVALYLDWTIYWLNRVIR